MYQIDPGDIYRPLRKLEVLNYLTFHSLLDNQRNFISIGTGGHDPPDFKKWTPQFW